MATKKTDVVEKTTLAGITAEFGREDLNALRDKVNEIITFLNN